MEQLSHSDAGVRKLGAQALARLRPVDRVAEIQTYLILEADPGVAKWLALALGRIRNPSSLQFLERKLASTKSEDAADWMTISKRVLLDQGSEAEIRKLLESRASEAVLDGALMAWENAAVSPDVVRLLSAHTEHPNARVRRWSQLSLGTAAQVPDPSPVRAGLTDPDYLVREWAECSLSRILDPAAVPLLVERLEDEHPRVREWAVKALTCHDARPLTGYLMQRYHREGDDSCREAIVDALRPAATRADVREFIIESLQKEQSVLVLHALIRVVASTPSLTKDPEVAAAAAGRVAKAGDRSLLGRQMATELFGHATPEEQKALQTFAASPRLQLLGNILMSADVNLPQGSNNSNSVPTKAIPEELVLPTTELEPVVGVVIALKEEFRAFSKIVSNFSPVQDADVKDVYYSFTVPGPNGAQGHGVAMLIGDMGPDEAAYHGGRLLDRWKPSIIANIGIAGGIHEDVLLGDTIVARQVDNYISGAKAVKDRTKGSKGFRLQWHGSPYKADATFVTRVINFEFQHAERFQEWALAGKAELEQAAADSPAVADVLKAGYAREAPALVEGNVASGPIVGADRSFIDWLHERDRQFKGLEMEAAGVALAAHHDPRRARTLFIRGVSDFGDQRKKAIDRAGKGAFRALAMNNATRFFLAIMASIDLSSLK